MVSCPFCASVSQSFDKTQVTAVDYTSLSCGGQQPAFEVGLVRTDRNVVKNYRQLWKIAIILGPVMKSSQTNLLQGPEVEFLQDGLLV